MRMPLHERIRAEIEARILGGQLAPGVRLPVEHELMRDYDCSRMTVNKALSALAAAGLIERRKRAGTFVARPRVHSTVLDVPDLPGEVRARGQRYGWRLERRTLRAARDAAERELVGGGRLLAVNGVHLADDLPLALERRVVSLDAAPDILTADLVAEPPGNWLLHHVPWTDAETRIAAVAADQRIARGLAIDAGAACLLIERKTWRGATAVTQVRQTFPGSAYDLVARFTHRRGGIA